MMADSAVVLYGCYAHERGESGTPHLQGYFQLGNSMTLTAIKSRWGEALQRAHLEVARGTGGQNRAYCSKQCNDNNPLHEWGTPPKGNGQGGAGDTLLPLCEALVAGQSMKAVSLLNLSTYVRNYRGLERLQHLHAPARVGFSKVFWCHGPTRSGKTRWAKALAPPAERFIKEPSLWWDGYIPQEHRVVIIDDFRNWGENCLQTLLRWCDRDECTVQVKGGTLNLRPEIIVFTTPYDIDRSFSGATEDLEQLKARIRESGGAVMAFPLAPAAVPEAAAQPARIAFEAHARMAPPAPPPPVVEPSATTPSTPPPPRRVPSSTTPSVAWTPMRSLKDLEQQIKDWEEQIRRWHDEIEDELAAAAVHPNQEGAEPHYRRIDDLRDRVHELDDRIERARDELVLPVYAEAFARAPEGRSVGYVAATPSVFVDDAAEEGEEEEEDEEVVEARRRNRRRTAVMED